jgi:hypothetical protein
MAISFPRKRNNYVGQWFRHVFRVELATFAGAWINTLRIGCSSSGHEFATYGRIHVMKKLTAAGVLAAAASGALLLGSPAYADNHTNGRGGIASGNQILAPITAPVLVCGNSAAVLGLAGSGC